MPRGNEDLYTLFEPLEPLINSANILFVIHDMKILKEMKRYIKYK